MPSRARLAPLSLIAPLGAVCAMPSRLSDSPHLRTLQPYVQTTYLEACGIVYHPGELLKMVASNASSWLLSWCWLTIKITENARRGG
jgi:hypothetical protein